MSRSKFKGPFYNPFYKKSFSVKNKYKLKLKNKTNTILPEYVSKTVDIYNGKNWVSLKILENMVGYRFGSFVFTRKVFKYKK